MHHEARFFHTSYKPTPDCSGSLFTSLVCSCSFPISSNHGNQGPVDKHVRGEGRQVHRVAWFQGQIVRICWTADRERLTQMHFHTKACWMRDWVTFSYRVSVSLVDKMAGRNPGTQATGIYSTHENNQGTQPGTKHIIQNTGCTIHWETRGNRQTVKDRGKVEAVPQIGYTHMYNTA